MRASVAITGGARGIGLATAEALVARGARVAIGDLHLDAADAAATRLGDAAAAFHLDVSDRDSFAAFIESAERANGPLDVLINNAGFMPLGRYTAESDATAAATVAVNLGGVALGMRLVLPAMVELGRGQVVNVASLAGQVPLPGGASYSAAKHAVVGLTEAVREEIRGSGVELTVVLPAPVATELASGVPTVRGLRPLPPARVAERIAAAVERPRPRVYVPRWGRLAAAAYALAPALVTGLASRLADTSVAIDSVDEQARAPYRARIDEIVDRVAEH